MVWTRCEQTDRQTDRRPWRFSNSIIELINSNGELCNLIRELCNVIGELSLCISLE